MTATTATKKEWLTKYEAGARLNLGERRVLDYVQAGALKATRQLDAETGRRRVMIDAGDVERLVDERSRPAALTAVARTSRNGNNGSTSEGAAPVARPALALPAPALPHAPALPNCSWLNVDEAAAYTGLPAGFLLARIKEATLPCLDVGVRPGGRYRLKRSDLDSIQGKCGGPEHPPLA